MAGTFVVGAGDSWASIAGKIYGNQRWLLELAKANGGQYRVLHPGDVIELPDFDLSTQPFISNQDWYGDGTPEHPGVPTGMSGNDFLFGNSGGAAGYQNVPTPRVTGTPGVRGNGGRVAGNVGDPYSNIPGAARSNNPAYGTANRGYNPLPQGTGYSSGSRLATGDPYSGIPGASRQRGSGRSYTSGSMPNGGSAANVKPPRPVNPILQTQAAYRAQNANTQRYYNNSAQNVGDPFSGIPSAARQGAAGDYGQYPSAPAAAAQVNTITPGSNTPASDKSWRAEEARWSAWAIFGYYLNPKMTDYYLKESILPNGMDPLVAEELPYRGAGFNTAAEFMEALGYRVGPDGRWFLYKPKAGSGYTSQSYSSYTPPSERGGGGYGGGGGYTPYQYPQYGYPNEGLGMVFWRLGY